MPQTNPGSLDTPTYLSIVAYLLRENDLLATVDELTDDPESLRSIKLGEKANADSK